MSALVAATVAAVCVSRAEPGRVAGVWDFAGDALGVAIIERLGANSLWQRRRRERKSERHKTGV